MTTPDGGVLIRDTPGNVLRNMHTDEPHIARQDSDVQIPSVANGLPSTDERNMMSNVESCAKPHSVISQNGVATSSDTAAMRHLNKTTSAPKTPWKVLFSETDTVKKLKLLKGGASNQEAPAKSSGKPTVSSVIESIVMGTIRSTQPMQSKVSEVTAAESCQKPAGRIQTANLLVDISSAIESIEEEAVLETQPMQPSVSEDTASESDLDPTGEIQTTKLLVDFERNAYVCKSCEFEETDEDTFRKHVWLEVHPDGECSHTGSTHHGPGMDNADGCPHINKTMLRLDEKKRATDGQGGSETDVEQTTSGTTQEIAGEDFTTSGTTLAGEDETAAGTTQRTGGEDETIPGTTQSSDGEDQPTSGISTETAEDEQTSTQRATGEDETTNEPAQQTAGEDETLSGTAGEDETLSGTAGEDETLSGTAGEDETVSGTAGEDQTLTGTAGEDEITSGAAERPAGDDGTTATETTKDDDQTTTGAAAEDPTTNGIVKTEGDQTTTDDGQGTVDDVTNAATVQDPMESLPDMFDRKPTRAAARAAMSKLHQQSKNVYVVENEESSPDNSGADEDYKDDANIVDESSDDDSAEADTVEGSSSASISSVKVEKDDRPVPDIGKKPSSSDGIAGGGQSNISSKQSSEPTPLQLAARPRRGRPLTHFATDAISTNSTSTVQVQSKTVLNTKSIDHNKNAAKTTVTKSKKKDDKGDKDDSESESDTEEEGNFFKCRLPTCGQSFADVAGLRKHVQTSHKSMTLFPCPYCSCLWSDYNRLIEHIPAHVGPKPYRCVQCDVSYKKDASLRKHFKKSHHVNKQFTCTFDGCEYVTNLWTDFKVHSLSYHAGEKECACFACDATFPSMSDYFLHVESGMETLICCSLCTMKAKMRHTIIRHSGSVHQGVKNGVFVQTTVRCAQSVQTMQPIVPQPKRTVFVPMKRVILHECNQCDFADGNKASYDKHVRSHELNEKLQFAFSCEMCRFGSSDRMQYKMHIANHRKTPVHELRCFKCTHCTFATNQMKMIEKHLHEMHKERPFKFEVQQEVVIANGQNKSANSDVVQQSVAMVAPKTIVTLPKSGKSPTSSGNTSRQTAPSGNAIKKTSPSGPKQATVSSKLPASKTQQAKARQRRRTKRTCSDVEDDDDGNSYHPHTKRNKSVKKPEPERSANTDGLRRSSRVTTPVRTADAESVIACSSSEADEAYDTDDDELPTINAPVSRSAVIDRFHCDLCQFACSDWQLFHDHVESLHGNSTQWSNINVSVASASGAKEESANVMSGKDESASAVDAMSVKVEPVDGNAGSILGGGTPQEHNYLCNLCSTVCPDWESFEMHMEEAHNLQVIKTDEASPFQNIRATPIQKPLDPMKANRNGQFTCPSCQFSTTSKSNMWKHNKMHTLKLKAGFKCMYCSYSSPQKFVITRHVQSSHPDKPSDQTHVVVLQSRKAPTISLDAVEQPPNTSQKNAGAENQADETSGMADQGETKLHSDDDPDDDDSNVDQTGADCSGYCTRIDSYDLFQCKQCEFMHRFPSKVLRHFNYRHTKHCPYKCAYCDFRSVESGKVKRHCASAHRGQPPTVIKVEGDAGGASDTVGVVMSRSNKDEDVETEENDEDEPEGDDQSWWRRYVKTAADNNQMISCTLCGYQQVGMSALKRHVLAIHLGFTPFACKYCEFSTMEIRKVREHIKKTHPGLACKVIRRKYSERAADSVEHGVKVGHTSAAVGNAPHGIPSSMQSTSASATSTGVYIGLASSSTDTPIAQTMNTEINNTSMLSTMVLNVKPEPLSNDPLLNAPRLREQHIKFYKCIYCQFCSEDRFDDIRDHIFIAHLHRNHFNCAHCEFGSMTKGDVISHCLVDHPGQDQKVNEDREHSRSISILETHGDVLLVGMMSKDNVPLIELPKNLQAEMPSLGETPAPKASEVTQHEEEGKASPSVNVKSTKPVLDGSRKTRSKKGHGLHTCKKCGFAGMWYITVGNHILRTHLGMHSYGCTYCSVEFDGYKRMRTHVKTSHPRKKMCISYNAVKHRKLVTPHMKTPADAKKRRVNTASAPSALSKPQTPSQKKQANIRTYPVFRLQKKIQSGTHSGNRSTAAVGNARDVDDATSTCSESKPIKSRSSSTGINDAPSSAFLWKCKTCGTKLAMLEAMRNHVLTQHMHLQPFQCAVCDFGEGSTDLVETHIRETHQHSRIHIPVMDVVTEKADGLKKQMIRVRAKKAPVSTDASNGETFGYTHTVGKTGLSMYKCNLCDHEVRSKDKMVFHYKSHAQFRSYGCGYCAYKAVNKFFVQKHINKVHEGRPLKYHFSEKSGDDVENPTSGAELSTSETTVLSSAGQYTASKRMSPGDKASAQDVKPTTADTTTTAACDSEFVMPSPVGSLSTDDCQRPMYACLMCGKTKMQQQSVQYHVMSEHLNYKPYRCKYCKHTGTNRRCVRDHITSKHAGKPISISYRRQKRLEDIVSENVIQAINVSIADDATKPSQGDGDGSPKPPQTTDDTTNEPTTPSNESFKCVLCKGYSTSWKFGMLRHITKEIEYSPFECPYCPYCTNRQDEVRQHVKATHPQLKVTVRFNKNETKENRALELLEMSVVARDTGAASSAEQLHGASSGSKTGYKRGWSLVKEERSSTSPVHIKVRRPALWAPGLTVSWEEDEFQPSVRLVDVMRVTSLDLKRLLVKQHFANVSILF